MNKRQKRTKKPKTKRNVQVRDLKPRDAKGGEGHIEIQHYGFSAAR
jgi:hypothetical protein